MRSPRESHIGIFGAGASGREVAWLAKQCHGDKLKLTFIVDDQYVGAGVVNSIPVVSLDEFVRRFPCVKVSVAVGDPKQREECVRRCSARGLDFATLIHPRTEASQWVSIGKGTIICAGSILTTNIDIGDHVHINVACSISHDAEIGDFATISPGVHIAGWVTIGQGSFLGTGAAVKNGCSSQRIVVGERAVIGAGACVISNVEPGVTVVGVPARSTR